MPADGGQFFSFLSFFPVRAGLASAWQVGHRPIYLLLRPATHAEKKEKNNNSQQLVIVEEVNRYIPCVSTCDNTSIIDIYYFSPFYP